jgi:hypothetical protein
MNNTLTKADAELLRGVANDMSSWPNAPKIVLQSLKYVADKIEATLPPTTVATFPAPAVMTPAEELAVGNGVCPRDQQRLRTVFVSNGINFHQCEACKAVFVTAP